MRELSTIQKIGNLNKIYAYDERGLGNANHLYRIDLHWEEPGGHILDYVEFQNGSRKDPESVSGVLDTDLLEIVRDRLIGFQSGDFASDDNAKALEHVEIALIHLNKRAIDRYDSNALCTYNK